MDTNEAFETLLKNAGAELEIAQQMGADHFTRGDTPQVRKCVDRVEKLQSLVRSVYELQSQWQDLIPELPSQWHDLLPELDDQSVSGTPTGKKTSLMEYRLPILQALVEFGGHSSVDQVCLRVEEIMSEVLHEIDYQMLPSRKEVRWRNTARWERCKMIEDGLLSKDAPYGTWQITEAGREYLKKFDQTTSQK